MCSSSVKPHQNCEASFSGCFQMVWFPSGGHELTLQLSQGKQRALWQGAWCGSREARWELKTIPLVISWMILDDTAWHGAWHRILLICTTAIRGSLLPCTITTIFCELPHPFASYFFHLSPHYFYVFIKKMCRATQLTSL